MEDSQQPHPNPSDSDSSEDPNPLATVSPAEITVAIFCALPLESVAVRYTLDEELHCRPRYSPQAKYVFSYGRIGEHKVVLARPHQIGPVKAALCAAAVSQLFPNVRFALMVGIGAGIPGKRDIRLGDIAVGVPRENHPGVVEYDLGEEDGGAFASKGIFNKPHPLLISADGCLEEEEIMGRSPLRKILRAITRKPSYGRPNAALDVLYDPTFHHVNKGADCSGCEVSSERRIVTRGMRDTKPKYPVVHRGLILSGGGVVKSPEHRDRLRRGHEDAICYEMEAAGIVDEIPCLVIRGICDYADTHKQDGWHRYAAAVAAAHCKAILCKIDGPDEPEDTLEQRTGDAIGECGFQMSHHYPQSGNLPWSDATAAIPRRLLPNSEVSASMVHQDTRRSRGLPHWSDD